MKLNALKRIALRPNAPRPVARRGASVAAMFLVIGAVAGCAAAVPMRPAENATNPACANISVELPDTIDDHAKRKTDAQATAAWGDPAVVLLTCGVEVPGPSTQRCITIKGVDWLVDDSDEDLGVFTTYGRDPAVQVVVDHVTSDSNALNTIANAVAVNPASGACTDPADATIDDDDILVPG